MNHPNTSSTRSPLAGLRLLSASLLMAGLVACGGGSDGSTTATAKSYKGTVTTFDSPQSFSVDGIPVDASGSNAVPQNMAKGTRVEIQGEMVNGRLQARRVELDDDDAGDDANVDPNELDGRVTAYSGPTHFSVDGIPVDASAAPTTLAVGVRVEVYGTMTNGTMVASRVKLEDQDSADDTPDDGDDDSPDDDTDDDSSDDDSAGGDDDSCDAVGKSDCEDDGKD
ncbi:hypothetical protein KIH07_20605 [Hydrogenophaga taeniospiralis]|uniref:DUF5666 domain-containing protein n=1 Tax=Hydrogenophaga taeniospiralis TaxID=65656 RepID=UPI001CFB87B4|nr:DUF5666 domain-containing protein [Hydrogenophaga taeniospiralis]MCB4366143.1 hypothetical protein [Hydrogenophaga taeniospiralis]